LNLQEGVKNRHLNDEQAGAALRYPCTQEAFIQDYIMWMTKESEGTQKLDKELRGAFWRYMPFTQPVKEKLKTHSFVYQELYQRDVNRSMSDGY